MAFIKKPARGGRRPTVEPHMSGGTGFFERHPEFLETSETMSSLDRLNLRHVGIIEENRDILQGRRVIDIASHDGRWAYAALDAGAAHVTGFEGRAALVKHSERTFAAKGVPAESYRFVTGDVHIRLLKAAVEADTVMCLGFLYHTSRYAELFKGIERTRAEHVIIDTRVITGVEGAMVQMRAETTGHQANALRDRFALDKRVLSAVPSEAAVVVMLEAAGYQVERRTDWERLLAEHPGAAGTPGYSTGTRITLRARRV